MRILLRTKESEPIYDLLIKNKSNQFKCNIQMIISNHNNLSSVAEQFDIDFLKINDDKKLIGIIKKEGVELIILARYMQIIPNNIVRLFNNKIICFTKQHIFNKTICLSINKTDC